MQVTINDFTIAIGQDADRERLTAAGFSRRGLLQRLLRKEPRGGMVYETTDCTVTCFDDGFELYPCTHSYLTPDRRWNTAASLLLVDGRVQSALLRILDAKYAAAGFVSRFQEVCQDVLGTPHAADRWTTRWENGGTAVTILLEPDAKNACFLFEAAAPTATS
jgi:hypothetical protein